LGALGGKFPVTVLYFLDVGAHHAHQVECNPRLVPAQAFEKTCLPGQRLAVFGGFGADRVGGSWFRQADRPKHLARRDDTQDDLLPVHSHLAQADTPADQDIQVGGRVSLLEEVTVLFHQAQLPGSPDVFQFIRGEAPEECSAAEDGGKACYREHVSPEYITNPDIYGIMDK